MKSAPPGHIGIVACSAEGAALCYREICREDTDLFGDHHHPEVSMHTLPFGRYVRPIDEGDWQAVGELMLESSEKVARSGAEFVICPDNTIHQALPLIESRLPLPWMHIADIVADEALTRGYRKVGVTGTRWLVESRVYPDALRARGIGFTLPEPDERDEMNRIIMDELVRGVFRDSSIEFFQTMFSRFKDDDCDGVVLGCTEIPLVMDDENSPLPTLDSTRLLARAAIIRAVRNAPV